MELPQQSSSSSSQYIINEPKYKGVRKRKWGKWVSEIRLPNSRERIWLGSYESPEKAARAFDAALYCLRGPAARFNFPDDPPSPSVIGGGRLLRPQEIQAVAAQYANNYEANREGRRGEEATAAMMTTSSTTTRATTTTTLSPRDGNGEGNYSNTTSDEDGVVRVASGTTIDWSFLDSREQGAGAAAASDHHFELFSGMDNMSMNMDMNMNMGGGDYYHDPQHMMIFDSNDVINDHHYHHDEMLGDHEPASYSLSSFLWNF